MDVHKKMRVDTVSRMAFCGDVVMNVKKKE